MRLKNKDLLQRLLLLWACGVSGLKRECGHGMWVT